MKSNCKNIYNIYCDESCHLEHDGNDIFVLGSIMCESSYAHIINSEILTIKKIYDFKKSSEIKWTKISPCNIDFYNHLVKYFFENDKLSFRGYVARGKKELNHNAYNQTYDDWYYKMYYRMLEFQLDKKTNSKFNIYLDIKDTNGAQKITKLKDYFNRHYGTERINHIQLVRSDEVALIQLTDLFIGALSYKCRKLNSSLAKLNVISNIEALSGQDLLLTTPYKNNKVNWFIWTPEHWR